MKHKKRGFTLIELMLSLGLFSVIIVVAFSIFHVSRKSQEVGNREFNIQANARIASQKLTNIIRESSAIFLLPDATKAFKADDLFKNKGNNVILDESFLISNANLKKAVEAYKGWNFITLNQSKTELREFKWDNATKKYTMNIILETQFIGDKPIKYSTIYKKTNPFFEDKLIEFEIETILGEDKSSKIKINSELEALSSLQVIEKRDDYVEGEAGEYISNSIYEGDLKSIFYRNDERPMPDYTQAIVSMVLDTSGSMGYKMGDGTRIGIMKNQAKQLIEKFSENKLGTTKINLIPFDSTANIVNEGNWVKFYNPKTNHEKKEEDGKSIQYNLLDKLKANGGTNVGDGMRRSYYTILDHNKTNEDKDKNKYIIILMDGVPTYASVKEKDGYQYLMGNGNSYYQKGPGNESSDFVMNYIGEISENLLKKIKDSKGKANLKVFLIGFSDDDKDFKELENVRKQITNKNIPAEIMKAKSDGELNEVFNKIKDIVLEDTWHIEGPPVEVSNEK